MVGVPSMISIAGTRPAEERLGVVEVMAGDPAFLSYVPSIERFFDTHPRWSFEGARAEAALERADSPEVDEQLTKQTDAAIARGVFGVPTLFVGDELFWGNDRFELVRHYVKKSL